MAKKEVQARFPFAGYGSAHAKEAGLGNETNVVRRGGSTLLQEACEDRVLLIMVAEEKRCKSLKWCSYMRSIGSRVYSPSQANRQPNHGLAFHTR
jgi:hypothetical protein